MPPKRPREVPNRPTPASRLSEQDQEILRIIKSKTDMGVSIAAIKFESKIAPNIVTKSIKTLLIKNEIKEVRSVHKAGAKMYMAREFEPSKEISGGSWYAEGALNTDLIEALRMCCLHCIKKQKVATVDMITNFVTGSNILVGMEFSTQQAVEILGSLVLDREIEQCTSTGTGEFQSVLRGRTCYRLRQGNEEPGGSALASIPCGACPRLRDCTLDGIISPKTCVYFDKWINSIDF